MSAVLGIAEICLSFLMLPDMGVKKTREFVSFIKTAHNDSPDYDDWEFVRMIGKWYDTYNKILILELS